MHPIGDKSNGVLLPEGVAADGMNVATGLTGRRGTNKISPVRILAASSRQLASRSSSTVLPAASAIVNNVLPDSTV